MFARMTLPGTVQSWLPRNWPLVIGALLIALPTMYYIATENWSTEQGSHGPLVLASGLWLLVKKWPEAARDAVRPPAWQIALLLLPLLALYGFARIVAIVEIEGFVMYAILIVALYAHIGFRALSRLWFPLFYLMFMIPLPETVVSMLTNPLKIWISSTSVSLLHTLGYPIASAGVTIQIGQYQLLVAAACAGLNSMITLSALSLFYVYINRLENPAYMIALIAAVIPVTMFSNLVRVLMLILINYHFGESAAQGFLHNFAGMTTFAVAIGLIFLFDRLGRRFWRPEPIAA
jgi:exosortase